MSSDPSRSPRTTDWTSGALMQALPGRQSLHQSIREQPLASLLGRAHREAVRQEQDAHQFQEFVGRPDMKALRKFQAKPKATPALHTLTTEAFPNAETLSRESATLPLWRCSRSA